jgi:hypothetical protein
MPPPTTCQHHNITGNFNPLLSCDKVQAMIHISKPEWWEYITLALESYEF